MAKKPSGTIQHGFKGPKCEHCDWGPTNDRSYSLPHGIEIDLGDTCDQCVQCFEGMVRSLGKLHGPDTFYPLVTWMGMEGFNFTLSEA